MKQAGEEVSEIDTFAVENPIGAQKPRQEIDFLDLLVVIARRKRMILLVTLAGALLACVAAFLLPARYTAVTRIMPPQQNQSVAAAIMGQLGGLGTLANVNGGMLPGLRDPNAIYVGLLESHTVERDLVKRFDLMKVYHQRFLSSAVKTLDDNTAITSGKSTLIVISVVDKDPRRSADLANAYVEELRQLTQGLAVTEAGQRRLFFEQQLEQTKNHLADAEVALRQTQQKTGVIELSGQARATIEAVANMRAEIASKEVELQAMETFATSQNPDRQRAEQQLEGLRGQLAKLEQQQNSGNGDIAVPTSEVPNVSLEYVRRLRDVRYQEALFDTLARQFEIAKLDEAKNAALIQVVDYAGVPDRRSSPRRLLIVVVATVLFFLIGVFWSLFSAGWGRLKQDAQKQEQISELRSAFRWVPHTRV
ncbi:MAG: Wzz/FepE/Etk N-terminal domain-containing protein [Acidobacteriaceae bacterium]|nr:Wzz/FepE/Etk N-terminal domain-containing protein [Acidobacteriaceae bacterium]